MSEVQQAPPLMDEAKRAKIDSAMSTLVDNGDLDRLVHLARLVGSAQDAMTDDIVGRVAQVAADGIDLVDQATRSGVGKALPAVAQLVENGDLDRVVHLARLVGSAQDAMTDDIIGRVGQIAADGLDLVDKATRSGLDKAMPAISRMAESGDLDRAADLLRLIGSMQDSLNDDMVVRLAGVASQGLFLVERMTRTGLAQQLMALAEHLERSGLAPDLLNAVDFAAKEVGSMPPSKGGMSGLMGLLALMQRPETIRAIHFAVAMLCSLCRARLDNPRLAENS